MRPICLFVIGSALGLVVYGFGISQGSTVMRAGSGIKIGTNERGTGSRSSRIGTVRGNSGVRIGEGRTHNSTRQRIIPSTPAPPPPQLFTHAPAPVHNDNQNITYLKVGMMVPYKSFGVREYTKAVTTALNNLQKSTRGPRLGLFQRYDIHVRIDMMELTPSPTGPLYLVLDPNFPLPHFFTIPYGTGSNANEDHPRRPTTTDIQRKRGYVSIRSVMQGTAWAEKTADQDQEQCMWSTQPPGRFSPFVQSRHTVAIKPVQQTVESPSSNSRDASGRKLKDTTGAPARTQHCTEKKRGPGGPPVSCSEKASAMRNPRFCQIKGAPISKVLKALRGKR